MKIWLLLVLGPLLAIATTPSGYAGVWPTGRFSSLTVYAGPPLPVPLGSPHCRTYRPWVVSRWQEVPSKNFLPARYARLSVLHGAFLASSVTWIVPRLVFNVNSLVPERVSSPAFGMPTSLRFLLALSSLADAFLNLQGPGVLGALVAVFLWLALSPPPNCFTSNTAPTITSPTATTAAIPAWI